MDPIVAQAVNMKYGSLKETASIYVAKMALEQMEKTGNELTDMLSEADIGAGPLPGGTLDIYA